MQVSVKVLRSIFIGFMLMFVVSTSSFAMEDAIVAIVNDEIVTLKDVREYIRSTYVSLSVEGTDEDRLKLIMADLEMNGVTKLIQDKLILTRANEIGLDVRKKVVDERIEGIKKNYPSEQAFVDGLINNGATVTDLRNKIEDQFKIQYVIDYEVKSKVKVNPKDVTEFYAQNIDEFQKPERVDLESIYIAFVSNPEQAHERSKKAIALIKEGKPFSDVAKEYSDTPSIGIVERGQILPEIENVVFNLESGKNSEIVEISNGLYIFKLIKKIPAQASSIDEVKGAITNLLHRQKFQQRFTEWLKDLQEKAYVEIK